LSKFIQFGVDWLYRARRKVATGSVIVLAGLMAWHVVFGANGIMVYEQKRREQRELSRQIESLVKQNKSLDQQIKALKNDPQAIEKEAREKLRYARPGEVVYTLPAGKPVFAVNEKK